GPAVGALPKHVVGAEFGALERAIDESHRATAAEAREREARVGAEAPKDEADAANRAKDQFLAMLAHELRNPLAAISNAVTVMEKLGHQDDDTARIRMIIGRQTHHLARLVDDLLDVARVTTGRIVVERQPVALGDVARRALQAFEAAGKTAQHEIVLKTNSVCVIGDASRLEQVVTNFLD